MYGFPRVEFMSRELAIEYATQDYFTATRSNLISISDGQSEKRQIRKLWKENKTDEPQVYARFYNFLDVDDPASRLTEAKCKSIVDFIHTSKEKRRQLVVHCWMGVSRSAAVAKFAVDYFGFYNPSLEHYTLYNKYVYRSLQEVLTGKFHY